MSAYPVAYRRSAKRFSRGFQGGWYRPRQWHELTTLPELKGPANDNIRLPTRWEQKSARRVAIMRSVSRVAPFLDYAWTVYDLFMDVADRMDALGTNHAGTTSSGTDCAFTGSGVLPGAYMGPLSCLVWSPKATLARWDGTGTGYVSEQWWNPAGPGYHKYKGYSLPAGHPRRGIPFSYGRPVYGDPHQIPSPLPQEYPFLKPIGKPDPAPRTWPWRSLPHRRPVPEQNPRERTERGPVRQPRPAPRPDPVPVPQPPLVPRPGTVALPVSRTVYAPGRPASNSGGLHFRQPPPRGTKEKKMRMWGPLAGIVGVASESGEMIDNFWKSLPARYKRRHPPPKNAWDKVRIIWREFEHIDPVDLGKNILIDQLKDVAWGKVGKAAGRSFNRNYKDGLIHNRPGWQTGPWDTVGRDINVF